MKPIFPISHRSASVCAGAYKTSFRAIGRDYFTREAHQHFATETAAFFLLMMTTALPLLNGANAVVELIRSTRGSILIPVIR